mmetsp:Transcript_21174/g.24241  ORF Transcript_21174/g.24241 Transcript_21174/m.24241 type:complete len:102 (+) Transcript_21174:61-366(+)
MKVTPNISTMYVLKSNNSSTKRTFQFFCFNTQLVNSWKLIIEIMIIIDSNNSKLDHYQQWLLLGSYVMMISFVFFYREFRFLSILFSFRFVMSAAAHHLGL